MRSQVSFIPWDWCFQAWFEPYSGCEQWWSHHPASASACESFQHNFLILVFHKCLVINLQRRWKIKTIPDQTSADSKDGGKRMCVWASPKCSCLPALNPCRGSVKVLSSHHSSVHNCCSHCPWLLPQTYVIRSLPHGCLIRSCLITSSRFCFRAMDVPKSPPDTRTCVCRSYRNGPN